MHRNFSGLVVAWAFVAGIESSAGGEPPSALDFSKCVSATDLFDKELDNSLRDQALREGFGHPGPQPDGPAFDRVSPDQSGFDKNHKSKLETVKNAKEVYDAA